MKKLILCFILMLVPFGVIADETTDDIIDKVTAAIPELSNKEVKSSSSGNQNYDMLFYSDSKEYAQVKATSDGIIISYSLNGTSENKKKRLPSISKSQAAQTSADFVKCVAVDIIDQLDTLMYNNTYNISSAGYNIHYTRSVYGLSYSNDGVNVWVDGQTGIVTRYNRIWNKEIEFYPAEKIISQNEAETEYENKIGFEPRYNKRLENGQAIPYLVYVPSNTGVIDAVTGEAILQKSTPALSNYNDMLAMYEKRTVLFENGDAAKEGLKTGKEAQKYARSVKEINLDENYAAKQAKYFKNTNGDFNITVTFEKGTLRTSVTLDAKTFEIIGFLSEENSSEKSSGSVDKANPKQITDNFLNKYLKQYLNELSIPQITMHKENDSILYTVIYERIVNKIPYKSNFVQFLLNGNGDINSMSFVWDKVQFEDTAGLITPRQAFSTYMERNGLQLVYMQISPDEARPVYSLSNQIPAILSAKSGLQLSYDGKPSKPKKSLAYTGLDDHYAKQQATALADCDIFVSEGNVFLDDNILQKDFIVLLAEISPGEMPVYKKQGGFTDEEIDMIYTDFVTRGVIDKSEINPDRFIARQDAVKYMLRTVGYRNVAELDGIFKMPFADSNKILPELYGYVSLARGLNIISGSEGKFYPDKKLTNADALVMIYNYLNR